MRVVHSNGKVTHGRMTHVNKHGHGIGYVNERTQLAEQADTKKHAEEYSRNNDPGHVEASDPKNYGR